MVGILQALPNTALWQRLAKERRLLQHPDGFDEGVQTHLLNFIPSRPMPEIAAEFLQAFADLYAPIPYLERVYHYSCKLARGRPRAFRSGGRTSGLLRGLLILCWRQGVVRETRWRFWIHLVQIALLHPQVLNDYLWLLMLNEHFIDYQTCVQDQVEQQLQYVASPSAALPQAPPVATAARS